MDKELLIYRIDSLLEHIDLVFNDTKGLSISDIEKSNLLLRATCFSVAQIGEMMNQLEKELSPKYDRLPWVDARKMRNVIVHDYVGTDVEQVYSTIQYDLPSLKAAFLAIRNDLLLDELSTERLVLRKLVIDDVNSIFNNWANDPEVTKYMTWKAHKSIEETKQILDIWLNEYKEPKTIRYGIVLKENNELIGAIDVVDYIDNNPEIGYCLSRKYWNKGYMTEACKAVVEYLFAIGYKTLLIEADERNIGSNRVIEKVGFKYTNKETKPCSSFKPDIITVNWYKIIKSDFYQSNKQGVTSSK